MKLPMTSGLSQLLVLLILALLPSANCSGVDVWKTRSVYQILTDRFAPSKGSPFEGTVCQNLKRYCGGTWKGIEQNLDYIKGMGFDAIWISPIVKNFDYSAHGDGYHGYWTKDFERLNHVWGSEKDLMRLIKTAHSKGILVMVDVVVNHSGYMKWDQVKNDYKYNDIVPFNKKEHYHTSCEINDWDNPWQLENCWLCGLPDLAQENPFVRQYLLNWVEKLVKKYGFDAIRIDAIVHVPKTFMSEFSKAAGVFQMGEVLKEEVEIVAPFQEHMDGVFNVPMFHTLRRVFGKKKQSMLQIQKQWQKEDKQFKNVDLLGLFADNHDMPRFLSHSPLEIESFKNSLIFTLTARGIPFFYYGSEHAYSGGDDPANRESMFADLKNTDSVIYQMVKKVNRARQQFKMYDQQMVEVVVKHDLYVYSRGPCIIALTNSAANIKAHLKNVPFKVSDVVCNLFDTNDCLIVEEAGLKIELNGGKAKIYVKDSDLQQSDQLMPIATNLAIFVIKMLSILLLVMGSYQLSQKLMSVRNGPDHHDQMKGD